MNTTAYAEFVFDGISFRQNPQAPELFSFVASSNTLTKICGVARKSEQFLTNYQRALDTDRVAREVTPFFRMPQNCSPTAIVLSIHESPITKIEFLDLGEPTGTNINLKKMKLRMMDIDRLSDAEVVQAAIKFLDARLAQDQGLSPANGPLPIEAEDEHSDDVADAESEADAEPTAAPEEDAEATAASGQEDDSDEDDQVELGKSMLRDMRDKLVQGDDLSGDLLSTLRDMLRPALVIDGQHRLFGAAAVEEDIPFLVCSLVQPDWKEQVFQFTVINDKARGIPRPFITSLAGMSLTSSELSEIRTRLAQAGVQLWEVEVMQLLGYDPRSPFFQKIEFKVSGSGAQGLGYQTMKRVGKAWFDPKNDGLLAVIEQLHKQQTGKKNRKALKDQWQKSDEWFEFFCVFWDSFRKKFEGTSLWQPHSNFMIAVILEQLQEVFLAYLASVSALTIETIKTSNAEKRRTEVRSQFSKIVDEFAAKFDEKHFAKPWAKKSLNHKDGKEALQDYFEKVRRGKHVGNHPLISGK